jgi:hypothetical protein
VPLAIKSTISTYELAVSIGIPYPARRQFVGGAGRDRIRLQH